MKNSFESNHLPAPGLGVFLTTLDTLVTGHEAIPSSDFHQKKKALPNLGDLLLVQRLSGTENSGVYTACILSRLWAGLPVTWENWRSCNHRISWFRALAQLFAEFQGERFVHFIPDFLSALDRTASWSHADVVDGIKYYVVATHARFCGEHVEQPKRPAFLGSGGWRLFGGSLGRWLSRRVLQTKKPFSQAFFYSFFQTKRGCASMDDSDFRATYVKHSKSLVNVAAELTPDVEQTLRRWTKLLFQKQKLHLPSEVDYEFSHNACFNRGRKKGGVLADVVAAVHCPEEYSRLLDDHVPSPYLQPHPCSDWVGWSCLRSLFPVYDHDSSCPLLGHLHDYWLGGDVEYNPIAEYVVPTADGGTEIKKGLKRIPFDLLCDVAEQYGDSRVRVAGISEPLKVRTVTAGCSLTYSASMPMQHFMHRTLKRRQPFALIGRPNSKQDLEWLTNHPMTERLSKYGEMFFVSGDYSGATDKLNIHATKIIMEGILETQDVPEQFRRICRSVLYEQEIHYPKKFKIEPVTQTNGQLMGSTLSFPVLCIANFACYSVALKRFLEKKTGKTVRLRFDDVNALINGDDTLGLMPLEMYLIWKEVTALFGFDLSPGKNLVHRNIATINSEQWYFDWNRLRWLPVPYFPVGLLIKGGSGKVARLGAKDDEKFDLGAVWNTIAKGSFNPRRSLGTYLRYHRKKILKCTHNGLLSLFASRAVGGCGFVFPRTHEAWQPRFTFFQRFLGRVRLQDCYTKDQLFRYGSKPQVRYPNVTTKLPLPWKALYRVDPDGSEERWEQNSNFSSVCSSDDEGEEFPNSCLDRYTQPGEDMVEQSFHFETPSWKSIGGMTRIVRRLRRENFGNLRSLLASEGDMVRALRWRSVKYRTSEAFVHVVFDKNQNLHAEEFETLCQEILPEVCP